LFEIFAASSSVKTIGVFAANFCPPVVLIAAEFHSWIPQDVDPVLIHHVPSGGFAPGASAELCNWFKSTSALVTNAAFETPSKLYAANSPYSFNSEP